jgi:hypothetical protein
LITGDYSTIHEEKRVRQLLKRRFQLIAVIVVLNACTIAPFSQQAYEQATSLKAEALILMDKATDSFSRHKSEVEAIKLDLDKAYEYAKGRPQNEISTRQWEIIKDPGRGSLGGFLKRWEDKEQLDQSFINEAKGIVSDSFDIVIELESGKQKPEDVTAK